MSNDQTSEGHINETYRLQVFSSGVVALIQVVTIILLGRYLDFKQLGAYALFQLAFRLALYLFEPGMYYSIVQQFQFNFKAIHILGKWQLGIGIFIVTSIIIFYFLNFDVSNIYILLNGVATIFVICVGSRFHNLLILSQHQKYIAIWQGLASVFELGFLLLFIFKFDPLIVFTSSIFIRFLLFYLACYIRVLYTPIEENEMDLSKINDFFLKPSGYQVLNQGVSFIQGQYDTVLISLLYGMQVLGPYNLATEYSYFVFSKMNPIFHRAIFPGIANTIYKGHNAVQIIWNSFLSYLIMIGGIYLLLWFYRSSILELAYGSGASEMVYFAGYILVVAFVKALNNILNTYLLSLGKSGTLFKMNIFMLVINYVFCFIFYKLNIELNTFLLFMIIYSILYFILGIILLGNFIALYDRGMIKSLFRIIITLIFIGLFFYIIQYLIGENFYSLVLAVMTLVLVMILFGGDRVGNLFKLRIT